MSLDPGSRAKFNLKNASILLVESGSMGMDILVQIMVGFGAKTLHKCETADQARQSVSRIEMDLMIIDAALGDEDGYELVRWIRRECVSDHNRYAPILMIAAHTQANKVTLARDCGAHFVIAKPLTPVVLLERILWVAREQRKMVTTDTYVGPDRRFKFEGPPAGMPGRRKDDLPEELGAAITPNMSQDEIDALMNPRKVSL